MNNNDILNSLAELIKSNNNKGISLDLAYKNFIEYSKTNCREVTVKYYEKLHKVLYKNLLDLGIKYTNEITKSIYKQLELQLKNQNYKNVSINKFTDLLKMIFKINFEMEFISSNPLQGIKKLKEEKPKIQIISKENLEKIDNHIKNLSNNFTNIRNISLILILKDTGIRLNELLNIKKENLFLNENTIFLDYTKTNNSRYVFFSDDTKFYLKQYVNLMPKNDNIYLFQSVIEPNKPLNRNIIYHFLEDISKACNIDQSITPHKWRHTCITNLVENNVNLTCIMKVAGHTEFSTTCRYIHQDIKSLKSQILGIKK